MDKTKGLSDEARILDDFLKQYRVCINRKHALEAREQDIIREFDMPLNAPVNDLSRGCNASEVYSMAIITAALANNI